MPIKIDDKNIKKIVIQRYPNILLNVLAVYAEGDYRFCFSFPKSYWLTRSTSSVNSYQLPCRASITAYIGWGSIMNKFYNDVTLYNKIEGTNYSTSYQEAIIKVPFVQITNNTTARNNVFLAVFDANNTQVGVTNVKSTLAANEVFDFPLLDMNGNTFQYSAWNTQYTIYTYYKSTTGTILNLSVKYIRAQVEFTPIPITVTIKANENIPANAYYGNQILSSVTINNSSVTIGADAFNGCTSLTQLTFPSLTTTQVGVLVTGGTWDTNWNRGSSLTSIVCSNGTYVL